MKTIANFVVDIFRVIGLLMLVPIWGVVLASVMINDCINAK